jgi:peptide deformylase
MIDNNILELVIYPDERLRQISEQVIKVDDEIRRNFDQLAAGVKHYKGIGLAGVQIGIMKDIFVVDHDYIVENYDKDIEPRRELIGGLLYMANAEIIEKSDELYEVDDGCLSIPGVWAKVKRSKSIKVKYLGYDGKEQIMEAYGLLAFCIQHEHDHTKGRLFIDYLSTLKRQMTIKKMEKYLKHLKM